MSEQTGGQTDALSYGDVIEILKIIDAAPGGHELTLQLGDLRVTVRKRDTRAPA